MRLFVPIVASIALAAPCGGCATVTRGTTAQVQILSEPEGAHATTSMGHSCVTPCTLTFGRKDEFTVTIAKPGYRPETVQVTTKIADAGAAGFAGNVLIGGLIGMGVDVATGATFEHVPNPVAVTLVPRPVSPPGRTAPPKNGIVPRAPRTGPES